MKVLVAGGAGYIGSHCVRQLSIAGHEPVVVDNLIYGHAGALAADVKLHRGDIGDAQFIDTVLAEEQPEIVMHFAAFCYVGESVTDPLKYYRNNVVATHVLLEAMLRRDVKRLVFSSSCATYGVPSTLPIVEGMLQQPINPYGQTKLDVENALRALARATGLSFSAFRYFNAAGASEDASIGEDHDPETHLIPLAIGAAKGDRPPLQVFGTDYPTPDGTCLRDYVHVDDLSRAHIAVFDRLSQPGAALFYNLGTGRPTSVKRIIAAVEAVSGRKVPVQYGSRREGDPAALYADATKAAAELGWKPKFTEIEPLIETAWKWHSTHPRGYAS